MSQRDIRAKGAQVPRAELAPCHSDMFCPFLLGSEPLGSTARGRGHCQQSLGPVARGRWHITGGTFMTDTATHVVSAVVGSLLSSQGF